MQCFKVVLEVRKLGRFRTLLAAGVGGSVLLLATVPALGRSSVTQEPSVSIGDASVPEGNSTSTMTFQVTLSAVSRSPVTVSFATANGTATAPTDYQATSGQLQFTPGETSKSVDVLIKGDTTFEPDETFSVTLANPVNATLGRAAGLGTIRNDDQSPPPPKVTCTCKRVTVRLAGFNAHGSTTLKGVFSGKEEAAEFWDFVVKVSLRCRSGDVPDCAGFVKTESPERFPPFATQKPKTFTCIAKRCDTETFTLEVRIRITRAQILDARKLWKASKQSLEKKLKIRAGCRGKTGTVHTFTLRFTNGNSFSASLSDQQGKPK